MNQINKPAPAKPRGKKSQKYSRLSRLRRRRPVRKVDESDLSEGFDSDSSHGSAKGSDISESASEKSDEEAAFDMESDSDMNSQESRSDLEDIEDEPGEEAKSPAESKEAPKAPEETKPVSAAKAEAPESVNGPAPATSEASIASNLQAMSTQMFQTKRCFRLAPTFTNVFVKPAAEPIPPITKEPEPLVNGEVEKTNLMERGKAGGSLSLYRVHCPGSLGPSLLFRGLRSHGPQFIPCISCSYMNRGLQGSGKAGCYNRRHRSAARLSLCYLLSRSHLSRRRLRLRRKHREQQVQPQ